MLNLEGKEWDKFKFIEIFNEPTAQPPNLNNFNF